MTQPNPLRILLVSCYELGRQPLGLASPLGFLREAGFEPRTLDLAVDCFDPERAAEAELVGICVPMHTALRLGVAAAARIREVNPDCQICFYGHYAWLNGEHLLANEADAVIGGEFETPLLELAQATAEGRSEAIPGLWRRGEPVGPHLKKLAFSRPSRDGLPPVSRYAQLEWRGELLLAGTVEASRGCLHLCRHCPIPPVYEGRFFVVPEQIVLDDIAQLVAAGVQHLSFADADFLNGPGHALSIARQLHQRFPELTFDITTKVEHILAHRGLFDELAALGCLFVVSAVESLSNTVLTILDKGHTRDDVFAAVEILERAGITLRPTLVAFTPWTSLADYLDVIDQVAARGMIDQLDPVQFSVRLLVPPGSWLLDQPEIQPFLGSLDQQRFVHDWTHPDPRMDALYQTVCEIVEIAGNEAQDARTTYTQIAAAAHALAGTTPLAPAALHSERAPRMTESWFC